MYPGYLLFFLMLFVPANYQMIKLFLLITVLVIVSFRLLRDFKFHLHPVVLLWTIFYICLGASWIFTGYRNAAPGAIPVATVYLLWPAVFCFFIAGGIDEKIFISLSRIMLTTTVIISLYGFSYILHSVGWLPDYLYLPINQHQRIGFAEGTIEADLYSLDSLLFLVPFSLSMLMSWPKDHSPPVSRWFLWFVNIVGIAMVLLSGRRALILVVAVSPLMTFTLQWFLADSVRRRSLVLPMKIGVPLSLLFVATIYYLQKTMGFSMWSTAEMIGQGFHFDSYLPAMIRKNQFAALLKCWSESPWFGKGLGATCTEFMRSRDLPWAYELTYLALLYHTGIFGFLAYASGIIWIFVKGVQIIRSDAFLGLMILPVLIGLGAFLIGNASNPYLTKFDSVWTVFLPIAIINHWLLKTQQYTEIAISRLPEVSTL
ncbi:MAG: hypothetical protein GF401_00670 [Chitinivibrionales bacterium]|nr:hypothetical protein [Chitinivibrionales bacterium]